MSDLALVWVPMGSSQDYLLGWCSLGWAIGVTVLYRLIIGLDRFGCWVGVGVGVAVEKCVLEWCVM